MEKAVGCVHCLRSCSFGRVCYVPSCIDLLHVAVVGDQQYVTCSKSCCSCWQGCWCGCACPCFVVAVARRLVLIYIITNIDLKTSRLRQTLRRRKPRKIASVEWTTSSMATAIATRLRKERLAFDKTQLPEV